MLMIGIEGLQLAAHEHTWLAAPEVGGLILFTRNYSDRAQLTRLIDAVRGARAAPLLIAVDQEGGPVQRFREGFTRLPALDTLGALWDRDAARAVALAEEHAWIMASELRAMDVDLSFAPVLDLARGNRAIGTRALHADAEAVATLGQAYVRGMRLAGMAATLKHFPGHGSVLEDTPPRGRARRAHAGRVARSRSASVRGGFRRRRRGGDDGARDLSRHRCVAGGLFAALDQGHSAGRDGLRRHRHQ